MTEERQCKSCRQWKPLFMFPRDKGCASGYRFDCCDCRNADKRARQAAMPKRPRKVECLAACNTALNNFKAAAEPANNGLFRRYA